VLQSVDSTVPQEKYSRLASLAPYFPENALTNEVILDMFLSEVRAEIIAAKIRMASAYCFDVSVGTIKQMRSSGVPDQIILAMVRRGERGGL
jgi:hypothetical protein